MVLFPEEIGTLNHTASNLNQTVLLGAGSTGCAYSMAGLLPAWRVWAEACEGESLPLSLLGKQFYQELISGPEFLNRCLCSVKAGPPGTLSSPFLEVFPGGLFLRWALLLSVEDGRVFAASEMLHA